MLECLIFGKKILQNAPRQVEAWAFKAGAWQCFGTGTWQVFTQINARFCATLRHFHFHSLFSLGHFLLPLFVCYTFVFAVRLTAYVWLCVFAFLPLRLLLLLLPNSELMENSNYNNFAPADKKVFQPRRFSFLFALPF